jgi:hypothetical protein
MHKALTVRQTEIHIAERLVLEPGTFQVRIRIKKMRRHKSPRTDKTKAELL